MFFSFYHLAYAYELNIKDCKCKLPVSKFIVGGREAPKTPWMVSLALARRPICGGILVNNQWYI